MDRIKNLEDERTITLRRLETTEEASATSSSSDDRDRESYEEDIEKVSGPSESMLTECLDDDSDEGVYEARMQSWTDERRKKMSSVRESLSDDLLPYEGILGDSSFSKEFIVPGDLWTFLFKYQKIGVRWLWALHTQRVGGILGDEMVREVGSCYKAHCLKLLDSRVWVKPFKLFHF